MPPSRVHGVPIRTIQLEQELAIRETDLGWRAPNAIRMRLHDEIARVEEFRLLASENRALAFEHIRTYWPGLTHEQFLQRASIILTYRDIVVADYTATARTMGNARPTHDELFNPYSDWNSTFD